MTDKSAAFELERQRAAATGRTEMVFVGRRAGQDWVATDEAGRPNVIRLPRQTVVVAWDRYLPASFGWEGYRVLPFPKRKHLGRPETPQPFDSPFCPWPGGRVPQAEWDAADEIPTYPHDVESRALVLERKVGVPNPARKPSA